MTPFLRASWRRLVSAGDLEGSIDELSGYWRTYGKFSAILRSPWLWLALVLTLICMPLWRCQDWTSSALGVLPNLLGFSIGAMAIVLAFPSVRMFSLLAERGREDSFYIDLASKFVHFVFVEVIAIALSLVAKAWNSGLFNFLGFWAFSYAITTGAATALSLFGVAQLYNYSARGDKDTPET